MIIFPELFFQLLKDYAYFISEVSLKEFLPVYIRKKTFLLTWE